MGSDRRTVRHRLFGGRGRRSFLTDFLTVLGLSALALTAACTSSSDGGPPPGTTTASGNGKVAAVDATTATSAKAIGGIDALIAAAKSEGTLNVIALQSDWANYGALIDGFEKKYGITIMSSQPEGSSQDEIDAVNLLRGSDRAPDVLDLGMAAALANTSLFAPYQVATWADIPAAGKEPTGLWVQDYSGFMSIGYDSAKVPEPSSVADLLRPEYKDKVALNGDPNQANAALNGVMMASVATGGSLDDISKGIDFFRQLKQQGNFLPVQASPVTIRSGATPVVFDWDYLLLPLVKDVPTWRVFLPTNAILGGYYAQAINSGAPHPAAARLWQEYLFSDEGQNLWLKGGARPVRLAAMTKAGTVDTTALEALPNLAGEPVFLSDDQAARAKKTLATAWAKAIS